MTRGSKPFDKPVPQGGARLRFGISFRISLIATLLLVVFLGVFAVSSSAAQTRQAEAETLEKARLLAREMNAAWEFIEINQSVIDTDSDGSYNFKGIYCAIAGKSIATLFSNGTDYVIRYVNENPRRANSSLDEYEQLAFEAFKDGAAAYYGMSTYRGEPYYRYVLPIRIGEACLDCHGEPAGEIDITGFPKEGMKIGDIGGAISIALPMTDYMNSIRTNTANQVIWTFALVLILFLALYIAIAKLVIRPIAQLEQKAARIEEGDFDPGETVARASGELKVLANRFDSMAKRLKSAHDNLEDQVEKRTEELTEANKLLMAQQKKLEKMNLRLQTESQYKSDFLAVMSHELKTPLTSILAFTGIWDELVPDEREEEREALAKIEENAQQLLFTVNNILEAARSDAGCEELELEEMDVIDLFGAIERSAGILADRKSINLVVSIDRNIPLILGDWAKLRRITENLVSNAVKFTDEGGEIKLKAAYDGETDELVIVVADNGRGISDEDLDRIFEKFVQVDGTPRRRYGGSGLGLAVVGDTISAYGGKIDVRSAIGEGSEFTVRLPAYSNQRGE